MPATRTPIASPAAWHAADVADARHWTIDLTDPERAELASVARSLAVSRGAPETMTPGDVRLPALAGTVARIVELLDRGCGFALVRGFPVDLLDEHEIELAYVALGLGLGTPVSQDAAGSLLGHVRDERIARAAPGVRLYRTRERQEFHTDGADIIGLLCLRTARSGGESKLASAYAVYNELLARRPDLLDVLYEPMWWDRNDEQAPGEDPAYALPVVSEVRGAPRIFFIGWYIRDAQRHASVPRLRPDQLDALAAIEAIANSDEFHVAMDFRPGDVQLLNNAKILHAREAYEDHDDPSARRHLLRLWLGAHAFDSVEELLRGGIPRR